MDARVLVCSPFNSSPLAYNGMIYEFCKVAADVSGGKLLAPSAIFDPDNYEQIATFRQKTAYEVRRIRAKIRNRLGRPRLPSVQPVQIQEKYDLLFYSCAFVHDLSNLDNFINWDTCSRSRVAFIMESWSNLLPRQKSYAQYLDKFDHIFLLNASSIKTMEKYTSTPCSFLPLAADCLMAAPSLTFPPRVIDVFSMGRRAPAVHQQLVSALERGEIFYVYDTAIGGPVLNWHQSRRANAEFIKRSRYFVAYDHTIGSVLKKREAAGEVALSMRYFEGAAGGSVMIGSRPNCAEFETCFDWPGCCYSCAARYRRCF